MKTKAEILNLVEEEDVEFIRLQYTDMFGNLKNAAVTASQLERVLDKKYAFDGAVIFGMEEKMEVDYYLCPDLSTFTLLPWRPQHGKVARMLCDIYDEDGNVLEMSPRAILRKVIQEAEAKGYTFYIDPEYEFFLFHTDEDGIPTTLTHEQAGYMDVGPLDLGENPRRDMVLALEEMGFEIESSHHEVAPGQQEIDFQEGEPMDIADSMVTFKSAVKSIARRFGLHATFMPKPKQGVAGSGLHLNISVYKDGRNLFNSADRKEVREEAKWFMGGIMKHAKGICAITNPIVNSYKRIMSGFGAPKEILWARREKHAMMKVRTLLGEDTKVELRFPDPSANPYLALAVCISAGMEGLENHIEPGEESVSMGTLPGTLREAIGCIQEDPFVEKVMGKEFLNVYTDAKMKEWDEYMSQVCDWEINKYLNRV